MHFGIVKFWNGRRRHDVAAIDQHRVVIGARDVTVMRQILKQIHMHQAILL